MNEQQDDQRMKEEEENDATTAQDAADDASMSNADESMSSSSSSDMMDEAEALVDIALDDLINTSACSSPFASPVSPSSSFPRRTASASFIQLPPAPLSPLHPRSLSLSFVPSQYEDASSPRKRKRQSMWLQAFLCPAMSKSTRSMTLDEENDRLIPWAAADQEPKKDEDGVQLLLVRNQVHGVQLRLSSNEPFVVATDEACWLPAQGHVPRARVQVDTSYVPSSAVHFQVEVFLIGFVEDENNQSTMEYLDRAAWSRDGAACEHGVYIRLRAGPSMDEGQYELPIRVFTQRAGFENEVLTWSSVVRIRMAPSSVVLPLPHDWRFHLDLWQHFTSIARFHRVALWSDRHFELIERYLVPLAGVGQRCITMVATEMPWIGQQCYQEKRYPSALYEHAVLRVIETSDQQLQVDFSVFDRLLALATKYHMDHEIEVFGLLSVWRDPVHGFDGVVMNESPRRSRSENDDAEEGSVVRDGWRIRCYCQRSKTFRYLRQIEEIALFLEQVHAHCVTLGIVDNVRLCADEPQDVRQFERQIAFLKQHAPGFHIKVAINHVDFFDRASASIKDFVPILPIVCGDLDRVRAKQREIHANGGRLCWYVCCGPQFPNQFVSSPLVETELIGFLTFFLGLDGFLRWNYCLWPAKPWNSLQWRAPTWKVGDMYFVLPGLDGFPVETLRFEGLRMAIQSFELLQLASDTLQADDPTQWNELKAQVAQYVFRSGLDMTAFGKLMDGTISPMDLYSLDPMDYERARTLIIETLVQRAVVDLNSHVSSSSSS